MRFHPASSTNCAADSIAKISCSTATRRWGDFFPALVLIRATSTHTVPQRVPLLFLPLDIRPSALAIHLRPLRMAGATHLGPSTRTWSLTEILSLGLRASMHSAWAATWFTTRRRTDLLSTVAMYADRLPTPGRG